jgi:hypothetical protein
MRDEQLRGAPQRGSHQYGNCCHNVFKPEPLVLFQQPQSILLHTPSIILYLLPTLFSAFVFLIAALLLRLDLIRTGRQRISTVAVHVNVKASRSGTSGFFSKPSLVVGYSCPKSYEIQFTAPFAQASV